MIEIRTFPFNVFAENTHVVFQLGGECMIIDPGCHSDKEFVTLKNFIEEHSLKPVKILNTHCHIDHILGVDKLKREYNIPFYIHAGEKAMLESAEMYAGIYGIRDFSPPVPDGYLEEGELVYLAGSTWKVLFIPGHSPGHIALYESAMQKCIVGDILFLESIGRTDLPGGDHNTLLKGIMNNLYSLPDEVEVYPGHGPNTFLGHEKKYNPFCRADNLS
jgi:glyoxylase-like metal-dependent hydrolase (beta-lactamase superfamily II)